MVTKKLTERVDSAFKGDNERSIIGDYLDRIYSNTQNADNAIRQSIIKLVFLIQRECGGSRIPHPLGWG